MPEIPEKLARSLAELAGLLLAPSDTQTTLDRVARLAEGMAQHCDGVSVTLLENGDPTTAACTAEVVRELDAAQYEAGAGPCLDAVDQLQVFNVSRLPDAGSWPEFRAAATESGIMSSLSLPLTFGGLSLGALNLYSREPNAFDECHEMALVFAAQAGVAVGGARLRGASEELLREIGEARRCADVVSQARDVLVKREGCTPEEALEILRQRSPA